MAKKTYKGKSTKPGGGGRFKRLADKLKRKRKTPKQAKAIAAKAGMKKYGKKKMQKMAKAGAKRAARSKARSSKAKRSR